MSPRCGVELDHVMFFCGAGAPEAEALLALGLREGPGNRHPGQGTVNRRFFFRNAYLELLWIENFAEATRPEVMPTGLWDRWSRRDSGICRIGLVFRPGPQPRGSPFPSWCYVPSYFPPGFSIDVARDIPDGEPLLFYLPFARADAMEESKQPPGGVRIGDITGVTLQLPDTGALSPSLRALVDIGAIAVRQGQDYRVDLLYSSESREIIDLRPNLPLRFTPAERRQAAAAIPGSPRS
jgi:hypothetical protein